MNKIRERRDQLSPDTGASTVVWLLLEAAIDEIDRLSWLVEGYRQAERLSQDSPSVKKEQQEASR